MAISSNLVGFIPQVLNDTNVALIPKCDNPKSMTNLRPFSLCNITFKVLSKVLANRLKPLLSKCIVEEQSTFME